MKKLIQIFGYCFIIYIWLFWMGHLLHAQSQTTVTGVVFDSGGTPATSGFVEFDLQPSNVGVQFFVSGVGVIAPQNTVCGIDGSGNVKNLANLANPCLVWGNSLISPANTTYTVQIAPGGVVSNVVSQECINGVSYSLATPVFCPRLSLNPQSAFVITTPIQQNLIPGVDAVFNLGSSLNRYANVFAANGTFTNLTLLNSPIFPDPLALTGSLSLLSTKDIRWNGDTFVKRGPGVGFLNVGTTSGGIDGTVTTGVFNAGSGYQIGGAGTSGRYLKGNGSNFVISTGSASGVGTPTACTNQFVTSLTLNSDAAPTTVCTTDVLASAQHANQGTTTTVLHGNAAGNPSFGVVTPSDATGNTTGSGNFVLATGGTLSGPVINGTPSGTGIPTLTIKKGTGSGANYTSTSTTYVVVDATNLCYTALIPAGWKLSIQANMPAGTNTAPVAFNVALTDNGACSTANAGLLQETAILPNGAGTGVTVSLGWVVVGDGATHNIALQYKTSNAADAVFIANGSASFLPVMLLNLSPSN